MKLYGSHLANLKYKDLQLFEQADATAITPTNIGSAAFDAVKKDFTDKAKAKDPDIQQLVDKSLSTGIGTYNGMKFYTAASNGKLSAIYIPIPGQYITDGTSTYLITNSLSKAKAEIPEGTDPELIKKYPTDIINKIKDAGTGSKEAIAALKNAGIKVYSADPMTTASLIKDHLISSYNIEGNDNATQLKLVKAYLSEEQYSTAKKYALAIQKAVTGTGTLDNNLISNILGLSFQPAFIKYAADVIYQSLYKTSIKSDIEGDTTGFYESMLVNLATLAREGTAPLGPSEATPNIDTLVEKVSSKTGNFYSSTDSELDKWIATNMATKSKEWWKTAKAMWQKDNTDSGDEDRATLEATFEDLYSGNNEALLLEFLKKVDA